MASRKKIRMSVSKTKSPENFVEEAKSSLEEKTTQMERNKTFLLRIPYPLWKEAKIEALRQGITLHEFIIEAIKEKIL